MIPFSNESINAPFNLHDVPFESDSKVAGDQFPIISLFGNSVITILQNDTYTDPGVSASDAEDGPLAVTTTGTVDTAVLGTYIITYSATDSAGQVTIAIRTVVVQQDTTAPIITNFTVVESGGDVVVSGNLDEASTVVVRRDGAVVATLADQATSFTFTDTTASTGTYTYTAVATDAANNSSATSSGTITIEDTTSPVITNFTVVQSGGDVVVSGDLDEASTVVVSRDGAVVATLADQTTSFAFTDTTTSTDTTYTYTAVATDASNNSSSTATGTITTTGDFDVVSILGNPTHTFTESVGSQSVQQYTGSTISSVFRVVGSFTQGTYNVLYELGAGGLGLVIYIHNGTLYAQAGRGVAGGDVELSYPIPSGTTVTDIVVSLSNSTVNSGNCTLWVDGSVVDTATNSGTSGVFGGNEGGPRRRYGYIAATRMGGDTQDYPLTNGTLDRVDVWAGSFLNAS